MMNDLTFPEDAEVWRSDIVTRRSGISVYLDGRNGSETVIEIRREAQRGQALLGARIISADALLVVESALKAVGGGQDETRTESMRVAEREDMTLQDHWPAGAGVGDIIETVEAIAAAVLLRVLGAQ